LVCVEPLAPVEYII
jgi:hypothetical protein